VIHPKERARFEHGIKSPTSSGVVEPHPRPHPAAAAGQLAVVFSVTSSNSRRSATVVRQATLRSMKVTAAATAVAAAAAAAAAMGQWVPRLTDGTLPSERELAAALVVLLHMRANW
jgi:hypothetical protein